MFYINHSAALYMETLSYSSVLMYLGLETPLRKILNLQTHLKLIGSCVDLKGLGVGGKWMVMPLRYLCRNVMTVLNDWISCCFSLTGLVFHLYIYIYIYIYIYSSSVHEAGQNKEKELASRLTRDRKHWCSADITRHFFSPSIYLL